MTREIKARESGGREVLHQKLNPRILSTRTFSKLFRNLETDISITLKVQGCQDAVLSSSRVKDD